jgi:hypothetical protein
VNAETIKTIVRLTGAAAEQRDPAENSRVKKHLIKAEPWPGTSRGWGPITRKIAGEKDD